MALAASTASTATKNTGQSHTIQLTGGTATTVYAFTVAQPGGGTFTGSVTTDGAGAASVPWPMHEKGTYTATFTPAATGTVTVTFKAV